MAASPCRPSAAPVVPAGPPAHLRELDEHMTAPWTPECGKPEPRHDSGGQPDEAQKLERPVGRCMTGERAVDGNQAERDERRDAPATDDHEGPAPAPVVPPGGSVVGARFHAGSVSRSRGRRSLTWSAPPLAPCRLRAERSCLMRNSDPPGACDLPHAVEPGSPFRPPTTRGALSRLRSRVRRSRSRRPPTCLHCGSPVALAHQDSRLPKTSRHVCARARQGLPLVTSSGARVRTPVMGGFMKPNTEAQRTRGGRRPIAGNLSGRASWGA
jgi:hypothetical protein